jgi:hypothetical protein
VAARTNHREVETLAGWVARAEAFTAADAAGWIIRLAKALEPLHALGGARGNVSAEAIRLEGAAPTSRGFLVDARRLRDVSAYHSPERTNGDGVSPEDDTWAAAVTLYFGLTASLPFPGADDREVQRRISGRPPWPLAVYDAGDERLQHILDRALSRDVAKRLMTLRDLREALETWHPDPGAKDLPPLEDDWDARGAHPSIPDGSLPILAGPAPVLAAPGGPVIPRAFSPGDEDDDGPTKVRDVSALREHLAAFSRPTVPPEIRPTPPLTPLPPTTPTPSIALAAVETQPEPPAPPVETEPSPPHAVPAKLDPPTPHAVPEPSAVIEPPAVPEPPAASPASVAPPAAPEPPVPSPTRSPERPVTSSSAAASVRPLATLAPTVPSSPVKPRGNSPSWTRLIAALVLLLAGGAALFLRFRPLLSSDPGQSSAQASSALVAPPASSAPASATPDAPASAAPSAVISAAPSAVISAAPSAATSAVPSAATGTDPTAVGACLMPLFAAATFAEPPASLGAVCQITDPRTGVQTVRTEVVLAGTHRLLSDGMREWAIIGWYDMAALAILRSSCCPSAPPLQVPASAPTCGIETAMKELAALATSATAEEADVTAAVGAYTRAAKCTAQAGAFVAFGQKGGIREGELVTFQKTLARARAAAKKK